MNDYVSRKIDILETKITCPICHGGSSYQITIEDIITDKLGHVLIETKKQFECVSCGYKAFEEEFLSWVKIEEKITTCPVCGFNGFKGILHSEILVKSIENKTTHEVVKTDIVTQPDSELYCLNCLTQFNMSKFHIKSEKLSSI